MKQNSGTKIQSIPLFLSRILDYKKAYGLKREVSFHTIHQPEAQKNFVPYKNFIFLGFLRNICVASTLQVPRLLRLLKVQLIKKT